MSFGEGGMDGLNKDGCCATRGAVKILACVRSQLLQSLYLSHFFTN